MTRQNLAVIAETFIETRSIRETERELKIPRTTLIRRLAEAYREGMLSDKDIADFTTIQREARTFLPAENQDLDKERARRVAAEQAANEAKNRLRRQDLAEIERESVLDMIGGLVDQPRNTPSWVISPKRSGSGQSIPVAIFSDWHLGETVNPREIHHVNEFNVRIARARVHELVERVVHLSKNYMGGQKVPGIVVPLLGDFVSGELHAELEATDELSVLQSIPEAVGLLEWALKSLADEFGRVHCPAVCGNHGRVFDKRPRAKGYVHRNADWLIYALLEQRFQNDPRVTFQFGEANEEFFEIYGVRFLAAHGDHLGVKGGDGIIGSLGPIMRGAVKVGKYSRSIGREFDHLIIGHWHQPLWLPGVIVNGALKGWDEYASRFLKVPANKPEQSLFFVHQERGITTRFEIVLGENDERGAPDEVASPSWLLAAE
jgi:predicted phosphodiesterase